MPRLVNNAALDLVSVTAATIYNSGALSTTAVQYPDCALGTVNFIRRVMVTNKSATAVVCIGLSATTTSPTFAAGATGAVAATEGIPVLPNSQFFINITANMALWVIASAASTPVQVQAFDVKAA